MVHTPAISTARQVLPRFGLPSDCEIAFVKYRENHVFRVATAGDEFALRLHRPGYRSAAEIASEIELLESLHAAGLSAPVPLFTHDGDPLATIPCWDGRERHVSMQRWMPAAGPLGDSASYFVGGAEADPALLYALGRTTALHHEQAILRGRPAGFVRPPWNHDGLSGPSPLWGDPSKLRTLSEADATLIRATAMHLHERLAAASVDRHSYGVIHADLTFENVLVRGTGASAEIVFIDFDDFGEGWFLFDLATPLFWLRPHPRYEVYEAALFGGYESVRPLGPAFDDLWDSLVLARGLTYLGWAADRPGDPASDFAEAHLSPWLLDAARHYSEHRSIA
ncbi:phosphotransferase enzyme family protein [Agromyces bauzanensis]